MAILPTQETLQELAERYLDAALGKTSGTGLLFDFVESPRFLEFSRQLGKEIVASDPDQPLVVGTVWSDVILAHGDARQVVRAGGGRDFLLVDNPERGSVYDGGQGSDSYVLLAPSGSATSNPDCLIFDILGGDPEPPPPQHRVLLPGLRADAGLTDHGRGLVTVADSAGTSVTFEALRPDGTPVPIAEIERSILLGPGQTPLVPGGAAPDPGLIFADGPVLRGTARSDVIAVHDEPTRLVDAGAGDDVIYFDLLGLEQADVPDHIVLNAGPGRDTYFIRTSADAPSSNPDCLIFDILGGDVYDNAVFPDLSKQTRLIDRDHGIEFDDPVSGANFVIDVLDQHGRSLSVGLVEYHILLGDAII